MISFLPPARPSTPVAVYLNVLPGEARQSIQAFNWLGILKLYIGAPSTMMSAARNSSSTTLVSSNSPCVDASTLAPPCTAAATISTMWPASAPASYSAFILANRMVGDWCYRQIAIGDFEIRYGLLQTADNTPRKLPADRLTAGYAGIDVQELHIWSP